MKDPNVDDGIFLGLDYDAYAAVDAINQTYLNEFAASAKHGRHWKDTGGRESTAALEFGRAVHLAILEPEKFDADVLMIPKLDKRTTLGKAAWANFNRLAAGRIVMQPDERSRVVRVARAIVSHPTARQLFSSRGANEVSIFWHDPATGLRCKARVDRIASYQGYSVALDLKTTKDVEPRKFQGSVTDYGYDVQAAHILAGLEVLKPTTDQQRVFFWLVVESEPPHDVGVFEAVHEMVLHARRRVERHLAAHKECLASGVWPGKVGDGVELMDLPEWRYKREPL